MPKDKVIAILNEEVARNRLKKQVVNTLVISYDSVINRVKKESAEILKMYQYAYCPDEIYKQTFAYNSEFRNRIYNVTDEFEGCLREIDWKRGRPYIWRKEDYDYLSHSNKLFARKFDENVDEEIINMLINKIKNESNS